MENLCHLLLENDHCHILFCSTSTGHAKVHAKKNLIATEDGAIDNIMYIYIYIYDIIHLYLHLYLCLYLYLYLYL